MIQTVNRSILACLAVIPFKWVPPVEGPGGIIDTRIILWGLVAALVTLYVINRKGS